MQDHLTALNIVPIVQSDSTIYEPALVGLVISGEGSLVYENDRGDTVTFVATAADDGGRYPFRLPGRVRRVLEATTIADANLSGLTLH